MSYLDSLPKMTREQLARLIARKTIPPQLAPPEPKPELNVTRHSGAFRFSGYGEWELALGRYWTWGRDCSEPERRRLWEEIRAHLDFAILGRFNEA
jgi:hypothetical protein